MRIFGVNRSWRGRSIELEGRFLNEVTGEPRRASLDVEMEVEFKRRDYAECRSTARRRLWLIGVRNHDSARYWFYLTNIAPQDFDAESLAQIYACGGQVELLFKELKSHYRLGELPTREAQIVEALILSSLITLLVSRRLLDAMRRRLRTMKHRASEGRWASLLANAATSSLDLVLLAARTAKVLARRLESMLLHEAVDPNKSLLHLLQCIDQRRAWAR